MFPHSAASMSVHTALVQVLLMQIFQGEPVSQPIFWFSGIYTLAGPSYTVFPEPQMWELLCRFML